MVLWLLAYLVVGQVGVPLLLALLGLDRGSLSARGQAGLHLVLDLNELLITVAILRRCLHGYKCDMAQLFPVRFQGSWPVQVGLASLCFPAVDWLAQQCVVSWVFDLHNR